MPARRSTRAPDDRFVAEARDALEQIDDALLLALAARVSCVRALWAHKRARRVPLRDPARERALIERAGALAPAPLGREEAERFMRAVLAVTRSAAKRR